MTIMKSPDRTVCDRCKKDAKKEKPHYYGSINCNIYYINESSIIENVFDNNPSRLDLCSECSENFIKWFKDELKISVKKSIRPEINIEE